MSEGSRLVGVMGVHVDDAALGGSGSSFEQAVARLKSRFPYRKWRVQSGEFCGAFYLQDPKTKAICMSQQTFAENIRAAFIPKGADNNQILTEQQTRVLRAINGSLNWIASQSRPDVAEANNAIRRVKQHKDVKIHFQPIPPEELCVCCHSDAAFANRDTHIQAGYVLAFVTKLSTKGKSHGGPQLVGRVTNFHEQ